MGYEVLLLYTSILYIELILDFIEKNKSFSGFI